MATSTGSSAKIEANKIGRAAFFAPEMVTSPWSGCVDPITRNFSIKTLKGHQLLIACPLLWGKRLHCDRVNIITLDVTH
ncbi:Uncharacterised protein [Vibrio cholerae]|nr:Uncharacterised protein [Vibrio cholerae]CSD10117.1 Uncharacterised protein [Vibrio cholerae]